MQPSSIHNKLNIMKNELGNLEIAADEAQPSEPAAPQPLESVAPVNEPRPE